MCMCISQGPNMLHKMIFYTPLMLEIYRKIILDNWLFLVHFSTRLQYLPHIVANDQNTDFNKLENKRVL